MIDILWAFQGH